VETTQIYLDADLAVFAHTDSCANPIRLSPPSANSLVRGVFAGNCQLLLPAGSSRRYLCESCLGCLVPCHGEPAECIYLFLPLGHRPSPTGAWVGLPASTREHDFPRSVFSRLQTFLYVQASEFATSQIVPTPAHTAAGQLRRLRPSRTCFVTSACIGYASRPNTGNWRHGDSHPVRFAALSAAPPCLCFRPYLLKCFGLNTDHVLFS